MFNYTPKTISAATRIQTLFRGHITRSLYALNQLPSNKQLNFRTLIVGNDPIINGLEKYKVIDAPIALIATSGLRSVLLACELGNNHYIPKLIIIDNSKQVHTFWDRIKKVFETSINQELFLTNVETFLKELENSEITKPDDDEKFNLYYLSKYPSQDSTVFLHNLFLDYTYDYVKKIITSTTFISQSWVDTDTFRKLKNILKYLNIKNVFAYPSNIVTTPIPCCQSCYNKQTDIILSNIAMMQPRLTIHTNCITTQPRPTEVYLLENTDKNDIFPILFSLGMKDPQEVLKNEIKRKLLLMFAEHNITSTLINEIVHSQDIETSIQNIHSVPGKVQIKLYEIYHTTLKQYSMAHLFKVENEEKSKLINSAGK